MQIMMYRSQFVFVYLFFYVTSKAPRLKLKTGADGVAPN